MRTIVMMHVLCIAEFGTEVVWEEEILTAVNMSWPTFIAVHSWAHKYCT
jgi:hypothetical protein